MKPLTIRDIRRFTGGKMIGQIIGAEPIISAVCTDTRHLSPQSLFICLRGENHDGHQYLSQAVAGGAIAALVDHAPAGFSGNVPMILVPDTRLAMGKLAAAVRKQLRGQVIGVGGSNGKTSTKHLIQAALSSSLHGTISPKSFNNDIGVPLTIFAAEPMQDYLVLEMGTNHPGEMKVLTNIAQPDIAVITNVSAEHLEGLGDLEGVRHEEASIITGLTADGFLIVNGDDAGLLEMTKPFTGRRVTFGFSHTNDLFPTDIHCDATGVRFRVNTSKTELFVPLLGRHTAANALAALAVARRLGVTDQALADGLAHAVGPEMRLNLQHLDKMTILNDAYNANPASMAAALQTLTDWPTAKRRIAILGDMRELGQASHELHQQVGKLAGQSNLDLLICVGIEVQHLAAAAQDAGLDASKIVHVPDSSAAVEALIPRLQAEDLLLIKGSRGMKLEQVITGLTEHNLSAGSKQR